jgi:cell division protein FtsB
MAEKTEPWHLDKRVPLALIFAILLQTLTLGWWAATIQQRVHVLEIDRDSQQSRLDNTRDVASALTTQIAVIDERTETLLEVTRSIGLKVDKLASAP